VVEILTDNKFNWIRLRLFVDPDAENGYSRGGGGFCGLEKTLEMARRIKASGMKLLLDFHYSDTWADPGKQFTPSAWKELHGSALEGKIYSYTNETVKRFVDEGVRPDMVQVGNEINNGMLWPQGKLPEGKLKVNSSEEMESFCVLLRCASAAVRAEVNDIVHNIPNGMGLGTFIWEPTSPRWGGLFDREGNTNESMKIYPAIHSEYTKQ
jgi:arabinogalactan endo-1,4-beta-galactosidase